MNDLISKGELLNYIGKECHFDTEHPLEAYAKLLWTIVSFPISRSDVEKAWSLEKEEQ